MLAPRSGAAALVIAALLTTACSSGSGDDDDGVDSPVTTTSVAETAQVAQDTTPATIRPSTTTTTTIRSRPGLPADSLFAELIGFSYVELDALSQSNLAARFSTDDRLDTVFEGAVAKGVQIDDRLGAVVVSVSLTTTAAADLDVVDDFVAGVIAEARAAPVTVTIGDQQLQRFVGADGTSNLLWRYENLFALITSREPADLDLVATALVDALTDSVPDPVPEECLDPDGATDGETATTGGEGDATAPPVVCPEDVAVPEGGDAEASTEG